MLNKALLTWMLAFLRAAVRNIPIAKIKYHHLMQVGIPRNRYTYFRLETSTRSTVTLGCISLLVSPVCHDKPKGSPFNIYTYTCYTRFSVQGRGAFQLLACLAAFFALVSSSRIKLSRSLCTIQSLAAPMTLSSVSPPCRTSGRLCTSIPAL